MKRRAFLLASVVSGWGLRAGAAPKAAAGSGLAQVNNVSLLGAHGLRAARAWLQVGMGVDAARGALLLDQSLHAFERGFAEYRGAAERAGLRDVPVLLEQRWRAFSLSAATQPTPQGARRVLPLSEELMIQSEKGATELAQLSGRAGALAVLKAGRARALTQQMARFALSRRWGVAPADAPVYLNQSRAEFPRLIAELLALPGNSALIVGQLQLAQQQWAFFDAALASVDDPKAPATVVMQAERFFEITQTLSAAYTQAG